MTTPEDILRATYKREKPVRPRWPDTYEQANADPIIHAALLALARRQVPAFTRKQATYSRPAPTVSSINQKTRGLDFKSLAAGEKPEPDDDQP